MTQQIGTSGLILKEKMIWERARAGRTGMSIPARDVEPAPLDPSLVGDAPGLPDVSELDVVRHFTRLSTYNYGVDHGTYPLGSCTMKYNPKTNERQAALPGFAGAHPLWPAALSQGALELMHALERHLAEITGMDAVSLQPAAGAHGELAGMLIVHAHHERQGRQRTKVIIPDTAHGTNPASVALCGYQPIPVASNEQGILAVEAVAALMDEDVAGIMVTNPNTLGLYEENLRRIAEVVHAKGGLVYGDGANMNAIMGIVQMGKVGVDVMHLNLHKTFTTPHGGGGPGSGPVCVTKKLAPYLPVPRVVEENGVYRLDFDRPESIGKIGAFWGHFGVLVRAYAYIRTMGAEGLKRASQLAVLNANYARAQLRGTLNIPYDRPCMHECIFNDKLQEESHVTTMDIAKSLIDAGFHPPTIYFPLVVHGAMMLEPTENESKAEVDEYIAAIREIAARAKTDPASLRAAPTKTIIRRLDETSAARKPCLRG
jgi:glycine dehydrogenase subunit 2